MSTPLDTRIIDLYERLPAGERRLADVLMESIGELAAYSATELAARAGVSKATAARLFRRLGYADFGELRQQARAGLNWGSPLQALDEAQSPAEGNLGVHLAQEIRNLTRTLEALRSDQVQQAVELLAGARRIWVVGFRNSYALAHYARGLLVQVKPDVRLLPVGGLTVTEDLASLADDDALLAIGFRRRPPVFGRILRAATAAGCHTVLLSEPVATDLPPADVTLRCQSRGASLFDSYVAPMSVLNFLCSGVALALGDRGRERLSEIEKLHDVFGDFVDGGNV
jgi:DNA-binding MurR/RpiR family transcriptional regulator